MVYRVRDITGCDVNRRCGIKEGLTYKNSYWHSSFCEKVCYLSQSVERIMLDQHLANISSQLLLDT